MPYREIEHTSETGFIVDGETLEQVFADAAEALFEVMTDTSKVSGTTSRKIALEEDNIEDLFHAWLEELNFLSQTEQEFYSGFDVSIEGNSLSALLHGEPIDMIKHEPRSEVKAITYGDFYLKEVDGKWQARVIVDI